MPFKGDFINNPLLNLSPLPTTDFQSIFLSKFINQEFFQKLCILLLYQADLSGVLNVKATEVTKFLIKFIYSISKDVRNLTTNSFTVSNNVISKLIFITKRILEMRENVNLRLVTYDNILNHFPKRDITTDKFLHLVSDNRITNMTDFRVSLDYVFQLIQAYNEINEVKKSLVQWLQFIENANKDDVSVFNLMKQYKETISDAYNDLSKLQVIAKQENLSDYFVLNNVSSVKKITRDILNFLQNGYSFFKTGYNLIDTEVGGFESSSLSIISGPSNHAKSILLINLMYSIIVSNAKEFQPNDTLVFITLEDDCYKLLRRFISIFGNYDADLVRKAWVKSAALLKENNSNDQIDKKVFDLISILLTESIRKVTGKNVNVVLKHCNENSFSPADICKFIDTLKLQGFNTRCLFVDYIDVMTTSSPTNKGDDYTNQGIIVQELRLLSRNYNLVLVTITQNVRSSENFDQAMSNQLIGDSIKKIRYADFVYMIRQRFDLDLLSEQVKNDVVDPNDNSSANLSLVDLSSPEFRKLIPFEIKITKAKEGKKGASKFHLFNGNNLRIYNTLKEFYSDLPQYKKINKDLSIIIDLLNDNSIQIPSNITESNILI